MALVKFTRRALEQLADHDAWRLANEWEPIALEIYDAVQAFFHPHNPVLLSSHSFRTHSLG